MTEHMAPIIVVGVDGSEESTRALRWAAGYASATSGTVEAVTAWRYPTNYGYAPDLELDPEADARVLLEKAVDEVRADYPRLWVTTTIAQGAPGQILAEACRKADLLVIGSRGRGGLAGALLGSVSNYCVHHAPCPVVVMRRHP